MGAKIIGVTGGSGSGKSTVVRRLREAQPHSVLIPQDNYYKSAPFISNKNITDFNFDHPDAFDMDLLYSNLMDLKEGKDIDMPQYDFVYHTRKENTVRVKSENLIILDGLMIFYDQRIRDALDLKIFVDTPADVRFIRRLQRDIRERGRTLESVIEQYTKVVRPGHHSFIEPYKEYADLIIPEGGHNENAMKVMFSFVRSIVL